MDKHGHIYALSEAEKAALLKELHANDERFEAEMVELREDVARLDGYLKARAEADAPKRERPNDDLTRRTS